MTIVSIKFNFPTIDQIYFPPWFYGQPLLVAKEDKKTVTVKWKSNLYTFYKYAVDIVYGENL